MLDFSVLLLWHEWCLFTYLKFRIKAKCLTWVKIRLQMQLIMHVWCIYPLGDANFVLIGLATIILTLVRQTLIRDLPSPPAFHFPKPLLSIKIGRVNWCEWADVSEHTKYLPEACTWCYAQLRSTDAARNGGNVTFYTNCESGSYKLGSWITYLTSAKKEKGLDAFNNKKSCWKAVVIIQVSFHLPHSVVT